LIAEALKDEELLSKLRLFITDERKNAYYNAYLEVVSV